MCTHTYALTCTHVYSLYSHYTTHSRVITEHNREPHTPTDSKLTAKKALACQLAACPKDKAFKGWVRGKQTDRPLEEMTLGRGPQKPIQFQGLYDAPHNVNICQNMN